VDLPHPRVRIEYRRADLGGSASACVSTSSVKIFVTLEADDADPSYS
jgi:hypothetical protein